MSFALTAAPIVLWCALRNRPRTVVCIEPTLFAAPAALLAARLVGARTVLHVQDLESEAAFATGYLRHARLLRWAARTFERAMRGRFDSIVTISDAMAARLRPQAKPGAVTVLRNWVPMNGSGPLLSRDTIRRAFGIGSGCRLVLYSGNFGAKQGLSVLVDAARRLRADPAIRFLVIGDGVMAGRLRAAAAGLPNLVVAGLLPPEHLGSLLAAADVHVLPQEQAAGDLVFPSKLGPLLQSGKPIVVTAEPCSELATWLGVAALRCRPGDGGALAAAIGRALREGCGPDPKIAAKLLSELDSDLVLPAFERCLLADRVLDGSSRSEPRLVPQALPAVVA